VQGDPDTAQAREWLALPAALEAVPLGALTEVASAFVLAGGDAVAHGRVAGAPLDVGVGARAGAHFRSAAELDPKPGSSRDEADRPGWLEATVTCGTPTRRCPAPIVVTPGGGVVSPFTPERARVSAGRVALSRKSRGVYRTLLVGGDPASQGKLRVIADGVAYERAFSGGRLGTQIETEILRF
jgi:hypothetical protein